MKMGTHPKSDPWINPLLLLSLLVVPVGGLVDGLGGGRRVGAAPDALRGVSSDQLKGTLCTRGHGPVEGKLGGEGYSSFEARALSTCTRGHSGRREGEGPSARRRRKREEEEEKEERRLGKHECNKQDGGWFARMRNLAYQCLPIPVLRCGSSPFTDRQNILTREYLELSYIERFDAFYPLTCFLLRHI